MLGPLMLGIAGLELTGEERERLQHPAVGGVILFARNYASPEQVQALCQALRALRQPTLVIAVDQEGGRVQRFQTGLSALPALRRLGEAYSHAPALALEAARQAGWLMAAELLALGVDLSFAPVLDLDYGVSTIIGDRSFGRDAQSVSALGLAWQRGAREAGMVSVGKHFPGHGGVAPDSHTADASDPRALSDLTHTDLLPFRRLIDNGLAGVMMAHVSYPQVDLQPASFSNAWINYLRKTLGFEGAIFSDDLDMAAAAVVGDRTARAQAALAAGCDMAIIGNAGRAADAVLSSVAAARTDQGLRLVRLHGRGTLAWADLSTHPHAQTARALLADL